MYFSFSITTPAETWETEKKETILSLRTGVIHHVRISIPPGPRGVAHIHINHMLKQLYPLNTNEDIHGDGEVIYFNDFYELHRGYTELKAYTWNDSTKHPHEFIVQFGVLPRWILLGYSVATKIAEGAKGLIGRWKEL